MPDAHFRKGAFPKLGLKSGLHSTEDCDIRDMETPMASSSISRSECEDLLFLEAQLLDEWRLDDWFALFTEDARYEVPSANSPDDVSPANHLFYIADDHARLGHRVARLQKETAYAEYPRSRLIHHVGNVRIVEGDARQTVTRSTFLTYRSRNETMDVYGGHHRHILRREGGVLRIAFKRSHIDMLNLRPQGSVSIIV